MPAARVWRPKVARVLADVINADSRYIALYGGRGGLKSHFFAEKGLIRCVQDHSTRWACLRETQKALRFSSKQLIEDKIREHNLGYYFDVQRDVIRIHPYETGGVIMFEGMQAHTADSIKSLEKFDIGSVEEAQMLSKRSLELLRPTISPIRKPGAALWFAWNPRLRTDAVDEFFRGSHPPKDAIIRRTNYRDNPWIDPDDQDIVRDRLADAALAAHVWDGEYFVDDQHQLFAYGWIVDARDAGLRLLDGSPGWQPDGSAPRLRVCVDVADGGADKTVISVFRNYQSFDVLLKQRSFHFASAVSPIRAAEAAIAMFDEFDGDKSTDDFVVDANGVGAGTCGKLILDGYRAIRYIGGADSDNKKRYRNRRVQTHITARDRLRDHKLVIDHDAFDDTSEFNEFVDHLTMVRRRPGVERVEDLELKEHMVQRTGKSPDRDESFVMNWATQLPELDFAGASTFQTFSGLSGGSHHEGGLAL